jgi:hypothetical protein
MYKGIIFFALANILGFFNMNLQFMSKWWADRPLLTTMVFCAPISYLFLLGTKYIVVDTGQYWPSKLIAYSVSTTIYAILTWIILKEGFLEPKTLVSLVLCFIIVAIQIFWK